MSLTRGDLPRWGGICSLRIPGRSIAAPGGAGTSLILCCGLFVRVRAYVLAALLAGAALGVACPAHAQPEPPPHIMEAAEAGGVAVWIDGAYHDRGSTIAVYGYSTQDPVTILVLNPDDNLADVHQMDTAGPFLLELDTAGPYWKMDGWYRLTAKAGPGSEPFSLVVGVGVGCSPGSIPVDAGDDGVHCMVSEGASAAVLDVPAKTLRLYAHEGGATLQIPRYLLDSRAGEGDMPFVVMRGDSSASYRELASDADFRTISVEEGGSVSISGTHVIPEFGAAMLVAAAAAGAGAYMSRFGRLAGIRTRLGPA